jgi:hypothetical protein
MAAVAALFASLFRPWSTQRQDEIQLPLPQNFTEVELLPHLTTKEILATTITWDKLRRFLKKKVVRLAPGVYVCPKSYRPFGYDPILVLGAPDDAAGMDVRVRSGTAIETAISGCNFLVRLLAASEKRKVYLYGHSGSLLLPVSGAALSHLFEHSQENLIKVTVGHVILNAEHIRALTIAPQHELELVLAWCKFSDNDTWRDPFLQWLKSGGGPTELDGCHIDSQLLADSLKCESRLSNLRLPSIRARRILFGCELSNDPDRALIFSALAENRGLTELYASGHSIGDESWSILCQSLQKHPTLTRVDLTETGPMNLSGDSCGLLSDKQKIRRTRELAEMMQTNTILCYISLSAGEYDEHIYTESIQPRLEANLYRPRVLAVKKQADERPFRQKILGRALARVSRESNLVWMFLSENVDAFVRFTEQESTHSSMVKVAVEVATAVGSGKRKRCQR